jgi:hypothetical protein
MFKPCSDQQRAPGEAPPPSPPLIGAKLRPPQSQLGPPTIPAGRCHIRSHQDTQVSSNCVILPSINLDSISNTNHMLWIRYQFHFPVSIWTLCLVQTIWFVSDVYLIQSKPNHVSRSQGWTPDWSNAVAITTGGSVDEVNVFIQPKVS